MAVGFIHPDRLVSLGDDTTDARGRTSALKVWQFGNEIRTLVGIVPGSPPPRISVTDDGDVEVRPTPSGPLRLYIGDDGGSAEGTPTTDGPAARPPPGLSSGRSQAGGWGAVCTRHPRLRLAWLARHR